MNANFLFCFILFLVGVAVLMVVIGYIRRPPIPLSQWAELQKRINTLITLRECVELARSKLIEAGPSKAVALKKFEEWLRQINVELDPLLDEERNELDVYNKMVDEHNKRVLELELELELEKKARNGDLIAFMEWKAFKGIDK